MRVITDTTQDTIDAPFIGWDIIRRRAEINERQAAEETAKLLALFPKRHTPEPQGPETWRQLIRTRSIMAQHRRNRAKFYRQLIARGVLPEV